MEFPSVIIKINDENLTEDEYHLADNTLKYLQLNTDDNLVNERFILYFEYINNNINISFLNKVAPFLASELTRQGK